VQFAGMRWRTAAVGIAKRRPCLDHSGLAATADPVAGDRPGLFVHPTGRQRYDAKWQQLSSIYYDSGMSAMQAQHPAQAVQALESALIYSHHNFQYQLQLTDALLASGATSEAVAQLHAFLEQHPGDAQVALKLARLEARRYHADELCATTGRPSTETGPSKPNLSAANRGAL